MIFKKYRIIAFALCAMLLLSIIPAQVSAGPTNSEEKYDDILLEKIRNMPEIDRISVWIEMNEFLSQERLDALVLEEYGEIKELEELRNARNHIRKREHLTFSKTFLNKTLPDLPKDCIIVISPTSTIGAWLTKEELALVAAADCVKCIIYNDPLATDAAATNTETSTSSEGKYSYSLQERIKESKQMDRFPVAITMNEVLSKERLDELVLEEYGEIKDLEELRNARNHIGIRERRAFCRNFLKATLPDLPESCVILISPTSSIIAWLTKAELDLVATADCVKRIDFYNPWEAEAVATDLIDRVWEDVHETDWFCTDIHTVYKKGFMLGTSKNTFSPNTVLSRAMAVTVLFRVAGEPEVTGESPFDDVPADQWYTKAVIWAQSQDIVNGYPDGKYHPNDNITREQLAAILYRYHNSFELNLDKQDDLSRFPDSNTVQEYAREAIGWAVASGLMNGVAADGLKYIYPGSNANRAQFAAMISRYIDYYESNPV